MDFFFNLWTSIYDPQRNYNSNFKEFHIVHMFHCLIFVYLLKSEILGRTVHKLSLGSGILNGYKLKSKSNIKRLSLNIRKKLLILYWNIKKI